MRAGAALERGRGGEAVQMLTPALRSSLTRDEELTVRSMLTEAALLQDDLDHAATVLGRPPDTFRDTVPPRRLSALWRLHGRLASARGDQSRAIAMHGRALKQAEVAHDSRAIGLAHYELGHCYRQVGDIAIVREHISKAASALHAAGDRRHLALVHSLSSITLAQLGRYDEGMAALRHAERLAANVRAEDMLATVCGNQANIMMLPVTPDGKPTGEATPYLQNLGAQSGGRFSPDGGWVAYEESTKSGQSEVFIDTFPERHRAIQISTNGGFGARWNPQGGEVFYRSLAGKLMAVNLQMDKNSADVSTPRELFTLPVSTLTYRPQYDVGQDGNRFLILVPVKKAPLELITNWQALLK